MGKIRSSFRQITPSTLKSKSDIPDQTDITVNASDIDCVNIKLTEVKNIIGCDTFSVYDVCRHDNVNVWSQFGPTVRSYLNTGTWAATLVNSKPTECKLGDFAGYDHFSSVIPGYVMDMDPTTIWINQGAYATLPISFNIGDFDYPNLGSNPGILLVLFDSLGAIKAWSLEDLNLLYESADLTATTIDTISSDTTGWYAGVYITNDNTVINPNNLQSTVRCIVPNCPLFDVNIKVKLPYSAVFADTQTAYPQSPWSITSGQSLTMNWSTGYATIPSYMSSTNSYTEINITIQLTDWTGAVIGEDTIFSGAYTAGQQISGTWYLGMINIPSYGYKVTVYIEESAF